MRGRDTQTPCLPHGLESWVQDPCWGRAEILWDLLTGWPWDLEAEREGSPEKEPRLAEQVGLGTGHVSWLEPWV